MGKVNLLDKEVYELIAAGEVVENPSSVVKELVENSIDAGSSVIEVEISGGGLEFIRVTDNGSGIERDDVRTAFLRHATSKIHKSQDLDTIMTLGFRGEALAAISAVSRIRLITKCHDDTYGTEIRLEGGEEVFFEDSGSKDGTTIIVSDLFFNTPARMKFLKKDVSEGNLVKSTVEKLSLSHPEISFRFIRDKKLLFTTPGVKDAYQAIYSIFPKEVAEEMFPVSYGNERCYVEGYASKPDASRKSRSWQYLYVNGRYVKLRNMQAAIEEAYRNLSMSGRYPSFLLNVYLPADCVDVNVHPAKTEVRFADERLVAGTLYHAVKQALDELAGNFGKLAFGKDIQTKQHDVKPAEPVKVEEKNVLNAPVSTVSTRHEAIRPAVKDIKPAVTVKQDPAANDNPFRDAPLPDLFKQLEPVNLDAPKQKRRYEPSIDIEVEYIEPAEEEKKEETISVKEDVKTSDPATAEQISFETSSTEEVQQESFPDEKPAPKLKLIGEAFTTYIIAELGDDMIIIDKHAAHERILFETLNEYDLTMDRQILLAPVIVNMSSEEKDAVLGAVKDIEKIGFVIEDFGDSSIAVREVPVYQKQGGIEDAVLEMAHQLTNGNVNIHTRETEWLLHSVSCRSAIKAGHRTTELEMLDLCEKIISGDVPKFCPHGRPVFFLMSRKELEKRFGRIE